MDTLILSTFLANELFFEGQSPYAFITPIFIHGCSINTECILKKLGLAHENHKSYNKRRMLNILDDADIRTVT